MIPTGEVMMKQTPKIRIDQTEMFGAKIKNSNQIGRTHTESFQKEDLRDIRERPESAHFSRRSSDKMEIEELSQSHHISGS